MKSNRQKIILELIRQNEIDTQETLMQKLLEMGIEVTQTTISRDIRDLNLIKVSTPGGNYHYVVSSDVGVNAKPMLRSGVSDAVIRMQAAGNMIVVKTHAGMANAVAVLIDSLGLREILGSVAGDDTILMVVSESSATDKVISIIRESLKI